jgi:hypothetical protein
MRKHASAFPKRCCAASLRERSQRAARRAPDLCGVRRAGGIDERRPHLVGVTG